MKKKRRLNLESISYKLALVPGAVYMIVFFILPLALLISYSVFKNKGYGRVEHTFTLENYIDFFTNPYYIETFLNSFFMAVIVSLLAILISYPLAYYIVRYKGFKANLVSSLIMVPMLASSVVTCFGWYIMLGHTGIINSALIALHIIDEPIQFLYTKGGVYVVLLAGQLPYMTTSIMNGIASIDENVEKAAKTLGAGPVKTFFSITLPLSLPGISAGTLLVFTGVLSAYVVPIVIGGGKVNTLSSLIVNQASTTLNWPKAAVMAFVLMVMSTLAMFLNNKIMESKRIGGGGR